MHISNLPELQENVTNAFRKLPPDILNSTNAAEKRCQKYKVCVDIHIGVRKG